MNLKPIRLFVVLSKVNTGGNIVEVSLTGPTWNGTSVVSIEGQRDLRNSLIESIKGVTTSIIGLKTDVSLESYPFSDLNYNDQICARVLTELLTDAELHILDSSGNVIVTPEENDAYVKARDEKIAELAELLKKKYVIQVEKENKFNYVSNAGSQYSKYFSSVGERPTDEGIYNSLKTIKSAITKEIRMYGRESVKSAARYEQLHYQDFPRLLSTLKVMKYENAEILPLDAEEQKEMDKILTNLDNRLFASTMGVDGA